ncbi:MAG: 30S ribosomal protein S20 [Candidatus Pacebacteria bacterium]|jgi:small subunit ribosomal protein S20|nr:30S ribosomal protein S20 [Candidatus Paceibacterota bacterium]
MAITKNAKKAVRSSERKRVYNLRRTTAMREVVKSVRKSATAGNVTDAKTDLAKAYKAIDKAAKRGVIKANTAARKKSRLAATVKKADKKD